MPISHLHLPRCRPAGRSVTAHGSSARRRLLAAAALLAAASLARSGPLDAQAPPRASATRPDDLLALDAAAPGAALPPDWKTRAVRGQQLPTTRIVDSGGVRFLRVSGTDRAGWFVRELPSPIAAATGQLHWDWRTPLSPRGADVTSPATDDAAIRVFVIFARHTRFPGTPRILFYTLGDGEPASSAAPRRSPFGVVIAGRPAQSRDWVHTTADPFRDYRALWREDPPRIIAIGIMQDTEQTMTAAIGDVRQLEWRTDAASTR